MIGKTLTISVAAFNVEVYLSKTLDSISACELLDEIEVIVVNDGSTDKTSDIAKKYVDAMPKSLVLINKENGGYGSTINVSLQCARGKYFRLIDGDDWVDTKQLDELVRRLKDCSADMIVTRYTKVHEDGDSETCSYPIAYDGQQVSFESVKFPVSMTMHALTFRTELLKNPPLNITEHCFYTDFEFMYKSIQRTQTVVAFDLSIYQYRIGREGQSVSLEGLRRNQDQHIAVTKRLIRLFERWDRDGTLTPRKRELFKLWCYSSITNRFIEFLKFGASRAMEQKLRLYDNDIKRLSPKMWQDSKKFGGLSTKLLRRSGLILYRPLSWAVAMQTRRE